MGCGASAGRGRLYTRIGPNVPDWKTLTSFNRIISSKARNVTISPARSCASANSSSNPIASVSDRPREQLLDPHFHGNLLGRQQHLRPLPGALHHRLKGVQQAEQIDFELGLVLVAGDLGDAAVRPQPLRRPQLFALVEQAGGGFVFLVLEEAADERVARIFFFALDAGGGFGPRQQHLRLDVNQRRRHHEVLARDVEVHLLHQLDGLEVLRGDERDGDVVDVHLVLLDEVKQQIERPLEVFELDGVGVDGGLEIVRLSMYFHR